MAAIEIMHLRKYYQKSRGLEDASLTVNEGEIFGFVGPNGAGKTTLIRILMNLIHKSSGDALIFGENVDGKAKELNEIIGYLPSETNFYAEMPVKDVLSFFAETRKIDFDRMNELVHILDLDLTKKVGALSFGNKKKLGIIVAMMHRPKLLILDEPTTGLDPLMQKKMLDLLKEEQKQGTTIFLSSHDLAEVQEACDRVALIKDGKINFVFKMDDLRVSSFKKLLIKPLNQSLSFPDLTYLGDVANASQYEYKGNINDLIQFLSKYRFESIDLRDSTLAEIFLDYYKKEA